MPSWDIRFDLPLDLKDERLIVALAQAEALATVIRQVPLTPFVEARLNRLNIIRAVHGTTAIEGANLTSEDVGRVIDRPSPALGRSQQVDEQEARNAEATLRYIASAIGEEPGLALTEDLIKQLNRLLTQGVEAPDHVPGRYRTISVSAGDYIAPLPSAVAGLMSRFVAWLESDEVRDWRPLVRAVAAHFYFVSIHPFADGNGRTARAIESFLIYQSASDVLGFHSLANFYYRNRARYMALLDEVRFSHSPSPKSERGSGGEVGLTPLVLFAAQGLVEELQTVHANVMEYVSGLVRRNLLDEALANAHLSTKTSDRLRKLATYIQREPVSLRSLRSGDHPLSALYIGASMRMIERDLETLEKMGLIGRDGGVLKAPPPLLTPIQGIFMH